MKQVSGGVTAAKGFTAGGVRCGVKQGLADGNQPVVSSMADYLSGKKDLAMITADWLADLGLNADVKEDELLVHGENGVWRIVVDKPGRGKRFSLKNKLFELMTQMDENVEKYSIVVMRDAAYLRDWKRLSAAAKQKINLSLLLCSANGHVKEYE